MKLGVSWFKCTREGSRDSHRRKTVGVFVRRCVYSTTVHPRVAGEGKVSARQQAADNVHKRPPDRSLIPFISVPAATLPEQQQIRAFTALLHSSSSSSNAPRTRKKNLFSARLRTLYFHHHHQHYIAQVIIYDLFISVGWAA